MDTFGLATNNICICCRFGCLRTPDRSERLHPTSRAAGMMAQPLFEPDGNGDASLLIRYSAS
jgi:hypothetical protein